MEDLAREGGAEVGRGVETALERIHAAGVVQGDVKWRNIMVGDGRVVWLDFSNAATKGGDEGAWGRMAEDEMGALRGMLRRCEVCGSLPDPRIVTAGWC